MGKITNLQRKFIDSFHCERLSCDELNKELIHKFVNIQGQSLVNYLRSKAWGEDINCANAFYLIKDTEGEVVLFFSLKSGIVFSPFDEEEYKNKIDSFKNVMRVFNMLKKDNTEEKKELARQIFEQYRTTDTDDMKQVILQIISDGKSAKKEMSLFEDDKNNEVNTNIHRVQKTYPAVEIVHFCVNDNFRHKWDKNIMNYHPMGEVLFWEFVVPRICDVQKIIGCQYVFLFAADISENASLINYYNVALKFQLRNDITTNKPSYDFCCTFMSQEIKDLIKNRENYFEHFNPDDDLV